MPLCCWQERPDTRAPAPRGRHKRRWQAPTSPAACSPGTRTQRHRLPEALRSNIPEVAVAALALGEALGAADAFGLDDAGTRRPFALEALTHGLAPGAVGGEAIGAHALLR